MTGPEHYAEAEFMLRQVVDAGDVPVAQGMAILAAAQVHATLALAAGQPRQPPPRFEPLPNPVSTGTRKR